MDKEKISVKDFQFLIFTFGLGAHLLFNLGARAGKGAWISSILSMVFTIPIVYVYGKIMSLYPGKNFYDILEIVFGKKFGKICIVLFMFHIFILAAIITNDFSDFIKVIVLFDTPIAVPMICIGVLSVWILHCGIEVISAWVHFFIRKIIIIIPIVIIMLLPQMDIMNTLPVFENGVKSILGEAFNLVNFPMSEVIVFISFFNYIESEKKIQTIFIKPLILGGILYATLIAVNILILGSNTYQEFYYTGYEAAKRLNLGNEYQRMEIMVTTAFTIIQFIQINYCILGVLKGAEKLFSLKSYKDVIVPIVLLVLNITYIMFDSKMSSMEFAQKYWSMYAVFMQIIFPIIILLIVMKKQKNKRGALK